MNEILTAVLYFKEDAERFLNDNPKVSRVYPLTPNALATIKGKTKLPILDPTHYFNDYGHRRVVSRVRTVERKLLPSILENNDLSVAAKETIRSMFHPLACSIFYLWYLLRSTGPWLIYSNNNWCRYDELSKVHFELFRKLSIDPKTIFWRTEERSIRIPFLINIANRIFLKTLKGKKVVWTTGTGSGMMDLTVELKKYHPEVYFISLLGKNEISFRVYMKKIINYFMNKEKVIWLVPLPDSNQNYLNMLNELIDEIDDFVIINIKDLVFYILKRWVSYVQSIGAYSSFLIKTTKPIAFIAHHMRWWEAAVIGEEIKKLKVKSILISHGTHPVCKNVVSLYEYQNLSRGLLYSPFATKTIAQSPIADQALTQYRNGIKGEKFKPLMWGYKSINGQMIKSNKIKTILHAGSFKNLGMKTWVSETSNEFVLGLKQLVDAVRKLKDTKLIIRFREMHECNKESLRKLLPLSHNCIIKVSGDFQKDLENADLLISFSSTTIEEALNARTPVALFGGSERYKHLQGSKIIPELNRRSAVYYLTKDNLPHMLNAILSAHHCKPLSDEELDSYVWDKTIPNREYFIRNLL